MSARRPFLFAALSLSLIGGLAVTAPKTTKYKVETKAENVADLSALGQGEQKTTIGVVNYLTITLDDTTGGQTVHAVLDSIIKADSNALPEQSALDSARGRTWHGLLTPEGKVTNVVRSDSSNSGPVGEIITTFFPRVKRGAKVGDQWTDTTEVVTDQAPQLVTTKTITNYSVTGTETRNGARVMKIEAAFSQAQTGEISAPGGTLNIEGTGQGTATYYVTADNRYLGGNSTTHSDLQITSDQLPEPIPVKSTNTVTVSVLP